LSEAKNQLLTGAEGFDIAARLTGVFTGPIGTLGLGQIRSGFVKTRVASPVRAEPLGLPGDAQADLAVHGGIDKAIYAYPSAHYALWNREFPEHAALWGPGSLGENLSLDGWDERDVCIGDTISLGTAVLQVTQPRKPCFKLALRFADDRLPKHLVDTGRCGWYYRVLRPGTFAAGDLLVLLKRAHPAWTIRRINAISYGADAPVDLLKELADLPELSVAWREQSHASIRAAEAAMLRTAFRRFRVAALQDESRTVRSFHLEPDDGAGVIAHFPGQHLVVRIPALPDGATLLRNYTLSAVSDGKHYQISVKREDRGGASAWLHKELKVGDTLYVLGPRGKFFLKPDDDRPIVLISAGVGVTPMAAMLQAAANNNGFAVLPSRVLFIHGARNGGEQAFAAQIDAAVARRLAVTSHIRFSAPEATDEMGVNHHSEGRIDKALIAELVAPLGEYDAYLCGPFSFMTDVVRWLDELGVPSERIKLESFEAAIVPGAHGNRAEDRSESRVVFKASQKSAIWKRGGRTLLQLAEEAGIRVASDCRVGICGVCTTRIRAGSVCYENEPSAEAGFDQVLVCCAQPMTETLELDL
jgi:ferredoxin-NADP reductase/MOSC domain-containing protein YiiM